MRFFHLLLFCCFVFQICLAQINPANITIARDKWGVPHIKANTDAECAYGLAYAMAEDNFVEMQESLLAVRGKLSQAKSKEGAIMDYFAAAIDVKNLVDKKYHTDLSADYRKVLNAYAQAVNTYAQRHPKEVLVKGVFPINGKDIIQGYTLAFTFLANVQNDILRIIQGTIGQYEDIPTGSNGFAVTAPKTIDGATYLAVNSHQPLSGPYAWYEAHLISDEGLNILGATFPGGTDIFVGTTPHLGWTHTVNHPDFSDVYRLKMNPNNATQYWYDGKWETLREETLKLKVKVGFLKIPVKRSLYFSKHGSVFKTPDDKFYAVRFTSNRSVGAAEQWHKMNKAQNFAEWKAALKTMGLPALNVIYADTESNIFYSSLGHFPQRNPQYDYTKVLPGDTSAVVWSDDEYLPYDSLIRYENPAAGYLYNTNNTPFHATAKNENVAPSTISSSIGYLKEDNNRAHRFRELIEAQDQISYEDFKRIKYDQSWASPAYNFSFQNLESVFQLEEKKYPQLATSIQILSNWDRASDIKSEGATIFRLLLHYAAEDLRAQGIYPNATPLTESFYIKHLQAAQDYLLKHYKTVRVPLGQLQRHKKGNKSLAISGLPDVLAAIHSAPQKDGRFKNIAGESYIQLLRYTKNGVEIESVHPYGASNHADNPHYTDQMELYVNHQLKPMSLDWEEIKANAERVYQLK